MEANDLTQGPITSLLASLLELCEKWRKQATTARVWRNAYIDEGDPRYDIAEHEAVALEVAASEVARLVVRWGGAVQSAHGGGGFSDLYEPPARADAPDPVRLIFVGNEAESAPILLTGIHEDAQSRLYVQTVARLPVCTGDAAALRHRAESAGLHILHLPSVDKLNESDAKRWEQLMRPALRHGTRVCRAALALWLR